MVLVTCQFKQKYKVFLKVICAITFAFCIYILVEYPIRDGNLIAIPTVIACIWAWFFFDRFKLEVLENKIVWKGIKYSISIEYLEVKKLELYSDHIVLKDRNKRIKISSDLTNQIEAMSLVLSKLSNRKSELVIKGDKKLVASFTT